MQFDTSRLAFCTAVILAVLLTPALHGQTTATCNGLPATIVATSPGLITGTAGDDVIVGTAGDDRILGMGGNDTICGLGGNDQITGGQGNDTLFGQEGNDTFFWFPGDGSDRMEASSGTDTLQVSGSAIGETMELSANGNRLRFFRNIANVLLDVSGVERVNIGARGGADLLVVNALAGTGVQQVTLDLESLENSKTPDGAADSIIVFGSAGNDQLLVTGSGSIINISGAGPAIQIRNSEGALDALMVYGVDGNDRIDASGLAAGLIRLTVEGGPGNDIITGSRGADSIVAGEGDDTIVWQLGTPADLIGGEAGTDTLQVVGSGAMDNVIVSAGALEAQIFNAVDGVNFLTDVEQIALLPAGGADQITVNAMAGAVLQKITVNLRPSADATAGDSSADTVQVNGTNGADTISITGSAGNVTLTGLTPTVVIQGAESTRDTLSVNALAGDDVLTAQGLAAGVIRLQIRGGQGIDTLTGSPADDLFSWFPGDGSDVIEGGLGTDTLQVNGSNIGEQMSFSANGSRLRFTRDIAAIVLDVNAVERVTLAALAGADTISFADLGATAVRQIAVDLGGSTDKTGDGQPDTLLISAQTAVPIATSLGAGTMTLSWPPVRITVAGVEPANDRLILQTSTGAVPLTSAVPVDTGAAAEGSAVAAAR